ncbi:SGNH hydrolase domain-containing protein [Actinoplanes solisilvae]|uniref:SGNH hydrolase domain-containing protein n=1 Tax=Actinoplanes solisilvae TaxID=2486853 RepID=UPI000FD9A8FD|nr:SGNH hydrolase domain-containing protein [Actinoplanes solisilvae]
MRTLFVSFLVALVAGCTPAVPPAPRITSAPAPKVPLSSVLAAVRQAPSLRELPADLTPALATAADDFGFDNSKCEAGPAADRVEACVFGDRASATDVVLWGDSHGGMWLPALSEIAERRDWRVQFYGKPACPTLPITFWNQQEQRPFHECDRFRDFVTAQIAAIRPELVIVTNASFSQKRGQGRLVTADEWQAGLTQTLRALRRSAQNVVVLGDTPVLDESAPECLAARRSDISRCATTRAVATSRVWNAADFEAARAAGAGYVSVLPWLCSAMCTPVIGNVTVYRNRFHLTGTYGRMLNGVLEEALITHFPQDAAT